MRAGTGEIEIIERIAVRRYSGRVSYPVSVLPERRFGSQKGAKRVPIGFRRILPVCADWVPAVAQPLLVGVAILRNDRGDAFRVAPRKAETGRRAVVEDVDREAIEADHFGKAIDGAC